MGRRVAGVFAVCALLYFGGFWALQHWRGRRGPWEVTFRTSPAGVPEIEIAAPGPGVGGVCVEFPGTNLARPVAGVTVRFDDPARRLAVPFGQVKFLDTTFLPGTVTFDLFGHEVELLPRTLILDKREHPWRSGDRWRLPVGETPAQAQ